MAVGDIVTGAAAGAFAGSRFGPAGTAVGAVIGGLLGFFGRPRAETGSSAREVTSQIVSAVEPRRWVTGRQRVAGVVAYAFTSSGIRAGQRLAVPDANLTLVLALSEGSIDGIERVWIDGEPVELSEVTLQDGDTVLAPASGVYRDFLLIYPYFRADGTQGRALWGVPNSRWTQAHRLEGVSWCAVQIQQGSQKRNDDGAPVFVRRATASGVIDEPVWIGPRFRRVPKLEFLVRGIRLRWPGQADPAWTDEAVPILRHALTSVADRPVAAGELDEDSFSRALAWGKAPVSTPGGVEKRWTANGVIRATDDWQAVLRQLGWTIQGGAPQVAGRHRFIGGAPVFGTPLLLDESVIVEVRSAAIGTTLAERVNAAACSVAQSAAHDWQRDTVEYADQELQAADGLKLGRDLGERNFVTAPYTALRLLAQAVRQLNLRSWVVSLRPGMDVYRRCRVGDAVRIRHAAWGLATPVPVSILAATPEADWSLSLFVVEAKARTFDEQTAVRLGFLDGAPGVGTDRVALLRSYSWGGTARWGGARYGLVEWRHGFSGHMLVATPAGTALAHAGRDWDGEPAAGEFEWPFGAGQAARRWTCPEVGQPGMEWIRVDCEWQGAPNVPRSQIRTPAAGHCLVDVRDATGWGASLQVPFGLWAALPIGALGARVTVGWAATPATASRNVALTGCTVSVGRTPAGGGTVPGDDEYEEHLREELAEGI